VFFLDTAPVVFDYIDVIWGMLRPGGLWINNGPLTYHWQSRGGDEMDDVAAADERFDRSVELPYADVRHAIVATGFHIAVSQTGFGGGGGPTSTTLGAARDGEQDALRQQSAGVAAAAVHVRPLHGRQTTGARGDR